MATSIVVRPRSLIRWAASGSAIVSALSLLAHLVHGFEPAKPEWWFLFLDVDSEANLPTWWSSGLLLLAALSAWLMAARARDRAPAERRGFLLVGALLAIVSADELAALHEKLAASIMLWLSEHGLPHLLVWSLGAVIVVALGAILIPFFRALDKPLRGALVLSAIVYVSGALVLEVIGQRYAAGHGWHDPIYVGLAALEELLEMSGAVLFLHAVSRELTREESTIALYSPEMRMTSNGSSARANNRTSSS